MALYKIDTNNLIVIPIFILLIVALSVMNVQFRRQAIEKIERAQENIVTDLETDINMMSMQLNLKKCC